MYCPYCHNKTTLTDVSLSSRNFLSENFHYKCNTCNNKFSEQEALNYEWDKMIEMCARAISPIECIRWAKGGLINEKNLFEYESAFAYHFGRDRKGLNLEEIKGLEIRLNRDNILNNIL